MKNTLLKWYMLAFLLVSNFVMFAQGTEDTDNAEDPDAAVPVNSKLIWLAILGVAFAFYYFSAKRKALTAK